MHMAATLSATAPSKPALGEVDIYDDLVPEALQRSILRLVRQPIWAYGWKSVKERDRFGFWHAHFAGGDNLDRENCAQALANNAAAAPIHALWQLLAAELLPDQEPVRVYANAHTYGVEGYVHTDNDDEDDYFTTLYYAHPVWDLNWSGETMFVSRANGDITRAVYPHPGRVIVFRGATPHVARSPSRECPELRVTVVFKSQTRR